MKRQKKTKPALWTTAFPAQFVGKIPKPPKPRKAYFNPRDIKIEKLPKPNPAREMAKLNEFRKLGLPAYINAMGFAELAAGVATGDQRLSRLWKKKRRGVRRRSKGRSRQYTVYIPAMLDFVKANPRCQRPGCRRPTTCVHHWAGRRGAQLLVEKDWRASCDECNAFAKDHPKEAREIGWLAPIGEYHT